MGDRVNFVFRAEEDAPALALSSHWGYTSRYTDLAAAIEHAKPRWGDYDYCARMIISHLIKDQIDSELHDGLFATTMEEIYSGTKFTDDYVLVDLKQQVVFVDGVEIPFSTFIQLIQQ